MKKDVLLPEDLNESRARQLIGRRIFEFRTAIGYSQQKLCKELGLQRSMVSKWESGKTRITVDHLYAMARKYGLNPNYILLLSETMIRPDLIKLTVVKGTE